MTISADNNALEQYCAQLDQEDDTEDDEDEDEDEGEMELTKTTKRKAKDLQGRNRPSEKPKAKAKAAVLLKYWLKLKCRETGEGQIYPTAEDGTISFTHENLASFQGEACLPCVGQKVLFTARKVSDTPVDADDSWADYSESAYEYAQVSRWRQVSVEI